MRRYLIVGCIGVVMVAATLAPASASNPAGGACIAPAGNPAPGTAAWQARDLTNVVCSTGRMVDEAASPAFAAAFTSQTPGLFAGQTLSMLEQPTHPHVSLGQLVPGGTTADPFRTVARWTAARRGRVTPISFTSSDGATLNGYVFEPPRSDVGPYPGVVVTTGSIQGYQQMYFWAAEGLAEAGYMVMTYDVQGQGNSDTLPAQCTVTACEGVPFQQSYNFFQGAEDALNWFVSTPTRPYRTPDSPATVNPSWARLDRGRVGIAGHSLGASAVSELGQCDKRVRAVVAWDNLSPSTGPCGAAVTIPPQAANVQPSLHTPALGLTSEYFLNPEPMSSPPDAHAKDGGYRQLAAAGDETMQIALRNSTHLEYSYVPAILPASEIGERVAFYYTLAWFDRYLRGDASAFRRLTATHFDGSADLHSIGAGTYSAAAAAAHPGDLTAGNVPYRIGGLAVADRVSFYYESEYRLGTTDGVKSCADIRAGCPATPPPTP